MEDKKSVRKKLLDIRKAFSDGFGIEASNKIFENIIASKDYINADIILGYISYNSEVDISNILKRAMSDGKTVYVPKVNLDSVVPDMSFFKYDESSVLEKGYKGIYEPLISTDLFVYDSRENKKVLLLCPGVGFDKSGHRLGYGKGFYDRYLCDKVNIIKMGIGYACQIYDNLPHDDNDVVMDYIITEDGVISLK